MIIYENADIGGSDEKRAKFGDYTLLVNLWIDNIGYTFSAPTLKIDEAVSIVESIVLVNA